MKQWCSSPAYTNIILSGNGNWFFSQALAIWTSLTWEDLEPHKAVIQKLVFRTSQMSCITSLRKKLMKLLVLDIFVWALGAKGTTFRIEDKQHRCNFFVLCEMCRNETTPSYQWKGPMADMYKVWECCLRCLLISVLLLTCWLICPILCACFMCFAHLSLH